MKLEAHGLRKNYGALVALDDLTFEAGAGEVVGLLGPNGAAQRRQPVRVDEGAVLARVADRRERPGFTSRIENRGTAALDGLFAHLNVVGLSCGIYVDPEDWSEERTKSVPPLGPGESTEVDWDVTAVTGGEAAIYVVVLRRDEPGRERLAISPAMDVGIAESVELNTDGVLPLTLAVPAAIAAAAVVVRRRRRHI